jgi:hypothetical protein
MSDVFISYSQPDTECAHEMVALLEGREVKCWMAPRDMTPAADWAAQIIDAISAARVMVLVFSSSSNQSPQVRREVERAVHKRLSILPFRIEDVQPSKSLEYFLSSHHWMDAFPPPREPHYERLCSHLQTELAMPAAPAPLAGLPSAQPSSAQTASPPPRAGGASAGGHGFAPAELQHIETQLAGYIGPLAKHLVKRAAVGAHDVQDLIARLASELDAESDRRLFVQRCRQSPAATNSTRRP